MAVRERASDGEGIGSGDERFTLEGAFDEIDDVTGQVREVAQGLVSDGVPLADGPSEQMSDVGRSLVAPRRGSHMNGAASCCHTGSVRRHAGCVKRSSEILVATFPDRNRG